MARPKTFTLRTKHLRRLAAGESQRSLARELGVSDTALRKRLRDPIVADKLASLRGQGDPQSPSPGPTPKAKGRSFPASQPEQSGPGIQGATDGPLTSMTSLRGGGGRFVSRAQSGDGRMRVGFSRRSAEDDWQAPVAVRAEGGAAGLTRHEQLGVWYDADDAADVARVEKLAALL